MWIEKTFVIRKAIRLERVIGKYCCLALQYKRKKQYKEGMQLLFFFCNIVPKKPVAET